MPRSRRCRRRRANSTRLPPFTRRVTADIGALDKHVGQLDKFTAIAQASTKKELAELQKLADSLAQAKEKSPEAAKIEKQVINAQRAFDEAMESLKAIDDVRSVAKDAKDAFTKIDPDGITKALRPVSTSAD